MVVDAVIPARNEAPTVAGVVAAARQCRFVRHVIVVDDGSSDTTVAEAEASGARVVRRPESGERGSKALALQAGVDASDAGAFLFCDADCIGLTADHLDAVCAPFAEGRAVMSIGWFDYGLWNPLVLRFAPTTGQRILPRWVWDSVPPHKRNGYSIEIMINEVIAEGHHRTTARIMAGVTHRTKRDKLGRLRGYRETWRMFWQLVGLPARGVVRWRTYLFYLQNLTVEAPAHPGLRLSGGPPGSPAGAAPPRPHRGRPR